MSIITAPVYTGNITKRGYCSAMGVQVYSGEKQLQLLMDSQLEW